MAYVLIALGGALGSVARHWCSLMLASKWGETFPFGTLFVNVVGSCLIGATLGVVEARAQTSVTRDFVNQFVMIGVLGGFTTFSSFSLQTLTLIRDRLWWQASANVLLSVGLCILAVMLGYFLAAQVAKAP